MTPAELIALADAATQQPWRVNDDWSDYGGVEAGPEGAGWIDPHGAYSDKRSDNLLMAMAPDLARLVAEMGEALTRIEAMNLTGVDSTGIIESSSDIARAALAKLSDLEMRA